MLEILKYYKWATEKIINILYFANADIRHFTHIKICLWNLSWKYLYKYRFYIKIHSNLLDILGFFFWMILFILPHHIPIINIHGRYWTKRIILRRCLPLIIPSSSRYQITLLSKFQQLIYIFIHKNFQTLTKTTGSGT